MAAESLVRSQSYLGARYRYLRAKLGGLKAVKAMARVLTCLYYRLVTKEQLWVDRGTAAFEQHRQQRDLASLQRKACSAKPAAWGCNSCRQRKPKRLNLPSVAAKATLRKGRGRSVDRDNAPTSYPMQARPVPSWAKMKFPGSRFMTNFRLPTIHPESYNRFNRLDSPRIAVATTGSNHGRVYVTFTSEVAPAPIPGTVGWWTRLRWTRRMAAKPSALLSERIACFRFGPMGVTAYPTRSSLHF